MPELQSQRNQGYSYRYQVGPTDADRVLLDLLVSKFKHSSRDDWRKRILAGELYVNGHSASCSQPLQSGAIVIWERSPWIEEPTPQTYATIYQDDDLLVVNKPAGLPTLPGGGFLENTLLHFVRTDFPQATPVHRLGRGTSGLVMFALNRTTAGSLSQHWPQIKKHYRALAKGSVANNSYDIRTNIGPTPHPRLGTVHACNSNGKQARSIIKVLHRSAEQTLLDVEIPTGRPHQIRIHLASIGYPLVGDPIYAVGGSLLCNPGLPSDLGYHLHARSLEFQHPGSHTLMHLHAELPADLRTPTESDS